MLRMEDDGISPWVFVLLGAGLLYLTQSPGVLQGFVDQYIVSPFRMLTTPEVTSNDIELGRKLAEGGFGQVYVGKAKNTVGNEVRKGQALIVKKADEFGEAEVWMNERLSRAAPNACAKYVTAFADEGPRFNAPLVLVWILEGTNTLDDLMQRPDFPLNCEAVIFGRSLRIDDPVLRRLATIKVITKQILTNLAEMHRTGIVHRDVKPQNIILAEEARRFKMIDLGAAADLRVGINYVPNEYLLDPRFAPPQQYVMSPLTPKAPPMPVAALLSPVLWRLNQPDRFDMYSAGIIMMQLAFSALRNDNGLVAFNAKLEEFDYDLRAWRESLTGRSLATYQDGFDTLDANGGDGWKLLCKLVTFRPTERLSAEQALRHEWFDDATSMSVVKRIAALADRAMDSIDAEGKLASTFIGSKDYITEAQIFEELEMDKAKEERAEIPRDMPRTIAWWQKKQLDAKIGNKAKGLFAGLGGAFVPSGNGDAKKEVRAMARGSGSATKRAYGLATPESRMVAAGNGAGRDKKGPASRSRDDDGSGDEKLVAKKAGNGLFDMFAKRK